MKVMEERGAFAEKTLGPTNQGELMMVSLLADEGPRRPRNIKGLVRS